MDEEKKIYRLFLKDELLGAIAERHGPPSFDTYGKGGPLMTLIEAVVSQQLSEKAAKSIFLRLEQFISGRPSGAASIPGAGVEVLRGFGISGNKAGTIMRICELAADGGLDMSLLEKMDDASVKRELQKINGIGEWTAQMHLIFGLKRKDVWPATDLGIRRNLSALLKKRKLMEPEKVEAYGKRWAPYRSYAAIYLWKA